MSILIKGMEMPTNCDNCLFDNSIWCLLNPKSAGMIYDIANGKPEWCPLVPIDADALMADVRAHSESYFGYDFEQEWVDDAPTIIEAEEGEHGEEKR